MTATCLAVYASIDLEQFHRNDKSEPQMEDGSNARDRAEQVEIKPPRWTHSIMMFIGAVLLSGFMLAVLWPR